MTKLWHWKSVKEQLKSKHNINVHFFDKSLGCIALYTYIYKSDKKVLHSKNHPNLRDIGSQSLHESQEGKKQCHSSITHHQKEQKYLLQRSIPNALVLQSTLLTTESGHSLQDIALTCRQEGEKAFFNFLARNTSKSVQEVIDYLWKIYGVAERENSETISKIGKLVSTRNQETKNTLPYVMEIAASCVSSKKVCGKL